jgi:hypothetical protein
MVNVSSSYAGWLARMGGEVVIRLSDGSEIRARSEDVTLSELAVLVAEPSGRRHVLPAGSVLSVSEAEDGSRDGGRHART